MRPPISFSNRSAFTLLELVVTLVITAITATVAIPVAGSSNAMQVRQAADSVANHFRYAQQLSIATGTKHGVYFDYTLEKYQVYRDGAPETIINDPARPGQTLVVDLTKDPYKTTNIDGTGTLPSADATSNTRFSNSGNTINKAKVIFDNVTGTPQVDDDTASPPDVITGKATLTRGGVTRTVTVEPTTGKVTVQ